MFQVYWIFLCGGFGLLCVRVIHLSYMSSVTLIVRLVLEKSAVTLLPQTALRGSSSYVATENAFKINASIDSSGACLNKCCWVACRVLDTTYLHTGKGGQIVELFSDVEQVC